MKLKSPLIDCMGDHWVFRYKACVFV